jgi:hypothetical protein
VGYSPHAVKTKEDAGGTCRMAAVDGKTRRGETEVFMAGLLLNI